MTERLMKARGRPKSVDRARAVQVARDQYWELGLSALSLNELCKLAGISKPALYREFGGEDGLQAAALADYREQVSRPLLESLKEERPFAAMLEGAIAYLSSDRGTPPGCLFVKMRLAGNKLGPLAAAEVQKLEVMQRDAYRDWYKRAIDAREANSELSADFAARYIDNQFSSLLTNMAMGIEPDEVRKIASVACEPLVAK